MFLSSLWGVKEPTRCSRTVGDDVPGAVAVLFSPAEVAVLEDGGVSKIACAV